jgi:hypothetical protein
LPQKKLAVALQVIGGQDARRAFIPKTYARVQKCMPEGSPIRSFAIAG